MKMFLCLCVVVMAVTQVYASGNSGSDEEDPLSSKSGSQLVSGSSTPGEVPAKPAKQKVPPLWEGEKPSSSNEYGDPKILRTRSSENPPAVLMNDDKSCEISMSDMVNSSFAPL